jgi:hypothetical protein
MNKGEKIEIKDVNISGYEILNYHLKGSFLRDELERKRKNFKFVRLYFRKIWQELCSIYYVFNLKNSKL